MARDLSTWSLWVAQRQSQDTEPQQGQPPLILNPKRRLGSWADAFDIHAVDCDAWLLRNGSVGAPAGDLQPLPPMRSMAERLRKAKQLAESGSKYGLLQAVLLSIDSQPTSAKLWLQQQVALEACSLLLLPECGAVRVDLGALRTAFSRLSPAEQQLWCQLQDARIHHARDANHQCANYNYDTRMPACAALLVITLDYKPVAPHLILRAALVTGQWGLVCQAYERYGVAGAQSPPSCMQDAYNYLLAAYRHYGPNSPQTLAAVAEATRLDRAARVPQLLAGLQYPCITRSPAMVQGTAAEALAYCKDYGEFWSSGSSGQGIMSIMSLLMEKGPPKEYSTQLTWLLKQRDIKVPTQAQQAEVWTLRCLVEGYWATCCEQAQPHAQTLVEHIKRHGRPTFDQVLPFKADTLRGAAVITATIGFLTYNLPPLAEAPRLWHRVAGIVGNAENIKAMLLMVAHILTPLLCHAMCDLAVKDQQQLQQKLGFWNIYEPTHLVYLLRGIPAIAARCLWQAGDVRGAMTKAVMLQKLNDQPSPTLFEMENAAAGGAVATSSSSSGGGGASSSVRSDLDGLARDFGHSLHVVDVQAQEELLPVEGMQVLVSFLEGEVKGQRSARQQLADKQLYGMFPGWLDQLVSQVVGRKVALVIDPPQAANPDADMVNCAMYLKEADGRRQPFCWKQPGDSDASKQFNWLVQQAQAQGATNLDMLRRFPTLEMQLPPMPRPRSGNAAAAASSGPAASAASNGAASGARGSGAGGKQCAYCGEVFAETKRCSLCKKVSYCSREHQKAHWKAVHKQECAGRSEQQS